MSRPRRGRIRISGTLEALAPLSVGGLEGGAEADLPLARDGRDRPCVPGTSLAGPLREWVRTAFGEELSRRLFGFQDGDAGEAARLFVEDARSGEHWTARRAGRQPPAHVRRVAEPLSPAPQLGDVGDPRPSGVGLLDPLDP
jgi:CRISPR/Cas system CSM-associated protein Csm3 (group 7 of RAMP superfamily)